MELKDRLKIVRESQNMTMREYGARLGISSSAVSQIESGKTGVSDQTIRSICREFGVSEAWLRTGVGEMCPADNRAEELARSVRDLFSDRPETTRTAILTTLLRYDPEGPEWAILEKILDDVEALRKKNPPEP